MYYTHAQKQTNKHTNTTLSHSLAALARFGPVPLWTISSSSISPERKAAATAFSPLLISRKTTQLFEYGALLQHYDTSSVDRVSILRRTNSLATSSLVL